MCLQVTTTEDKLQECIQSYESQIEDYRLKVEQLESSSQEQVKLLQQQLSDAQQRSEASSSELQAMLQNKVG
jgi:hypothetical protein